MAHAGESVARSVLFSLAVADKDSRDENKGEGDWQSYYKSCDQIRHSCSIISPLTVTRSYPRGCFPFQRLDFQACHIQL